MVNRENMENIAKIIKQSHLRSEDFIRGIRGLETREMQLMAAGYMCGFVDGSLLKK
ncbi:hypothetical protein QYF52_25680 [Paenibacillus polymyxa]|uniref:hypothetical protein n=1 Tax=Paenibacillus polymyxa TaxID=1406 RepID=UPI0025B66B89|nr:hypothetical protein [Paenibacillus polymyxa]MDN4081320.1 hypothetical protein [Paenibacillus polymyxa]MDN4116963.1 hypothetical protein [Paenibacillus polymyxa]